MCKASLTRLFASVCLLAGAGVHEGQSAPIKMPVNEPQIERVSAPDVVIHQAGLDEALVPWRQPTLEERSGLQAALTQFRQRSGSDSLAVLEGYVDTHPASPYRVAVLTNLGLAQYRAGYFSRAIQTWQQAWREHASADGTPAQPLVDRAVGELIRMHARLGHDDALARLLSEVDGRAMTGPATEAVAGAKEGLWHMRHNPGVAYLCGPAALSSVLEAIAPQQASGQSVLRSYRSGPQGVSLGQVEALAHQAGLAWTSGLRPQGAAVPIPSVVHWRVNHYAAVVGFDGRHYHIKDPTFGSDLWITPAALEAESSGYFVLPQAKLPAGWRMASAEEKTLVHGRGMTQQGSSSATSSEDVKSKPEGCSAGCARYNVHAMLVSLSIEDTPVSHRPSLGPEIAFKLSYNQRDDLRPASPSFSNLGPKWTHNWLSYIEDDPSNASANVMRFMLGGGAREEAQFNASTGMFAASRFDKAVLVRTSSNPVAYELRNPDGSVLVYRSSDNASTKPRRVFLTQKFDPFGNAVSLLYDTQNRLRKIMDGAGGVSELDYAVSGKPLLITKFTNAAGQTASLSYGADGRLSAITDAVGLVSSFEYGNTFSADFVRAMTTPYGRTTFEAQESGDRRWLIATDPMGRKERFEFRQQAPGVVTTENVAPAGFEPRFMDYRNAFYWNKNAHSLYGPTASNLNPDYTKAEVSHFLHDSLGRTSRTLESKIRFPDRRVWYGYAGQTTGSSPSIFEGTSDLPIQVIRVLPDGSSQVTKREYNPQGNVTRIVDPVGRDVFVDYAANGIDVVAVRRKTSASAYTTLASYTYNTKHQPLTYTDAAGKVTSYEYNQQGQLTLVSDALGQKTSLTYGADGYLASVVNPLGRTDVTLTYDVAGNLASTTDSQQRQVNYEYDGLNRRTKAIYPDGTSETWTYDKLDVVTYTNRVGVSTHYTYNANRELVTITQPVDGSTSRTSSYTYFPDGQVKTFTDGNGNVTTWDRDVQGRVTAKRYADAKGYTLAYDAVGRLLKRVDALNQTTTWGYARDDRLASITVTGATQSTPTTTFTWDAFYPRVSTMVDGIGTTQYDYVPPGTLGALQLKCDSGAWASTAICYAYDELGRVATRSVQAADATDTSTWSYDALGRVSQEVLGRLGTFSYQYLGDTQQITSRAGPSGIVSTFAYEDNLGDRRLKQITHPRIRTSLPVSGGTPGHIFTYETNPLGLIQGITTSDTRSIVKAQAMTYDQADRLISAAEGVNDPVTGALALSSNSYTLDAADNLLSVGTQYGDPPLEPSMAFQVNALNQATQQGGRAKVYDANGNLQRDNLGNYAWDGLDRMVTAPQRGGSMPVSSTWRYDGLNRRAESTSSGVAQRYRWCGEEICAVLNGSNQVQAWSYGNRGEVNGGRRLVYGEDHLGSVRQVHDGATGQWLLSVSYHAHGAVKDVRCSQSPDCSLPTKGGLTKGYAGLYPHGPTGLYLGTYRAYDPTAKRWLNRDPIEEEGGVNLYAYVGGNPINYYDSKGLQAVPVPALIPLTPALCWAIPQCQERMRKVGEDIYNSCKSAADRMFSDSFPPGVWPGDKGAAEWGRRSGVGAREGKGRFHGVKQGSGGRATENFGVDPDSGDVYDPAGDVVGNLGDVKSK